MREDYREHPNHYRSATKPTGQPSERRATVGEAARILGLTAEAVRSRVKRGTLRSTKEGATVYVLLEDLASQGQQGAADWTGTDPKSDRITPGQDSTDAQTPPEPAQTDDRARLVEALEDRIASLERHLAESSEANRELRRTILALTSRIPAIEAPQGSQAPPEGPEVHRPPP